MDCLLSEYSPRGYREKGDSGVMLIVSMAVLVETRSTTNTLPLGLSWEVASRDLGM